MKTSVGFIGGGRITKILLQAFFNRMRDFDSISVYDPDQETLEALRVKFPVIKEAASADEIMNENLVFLAVHPPVLKNLLDKLVNTNKETIFVSLAPKISLEILSSKLGTKQVARMIPNATSIINEGFNPIAFTENFNPYEKAELIGLLSHLGTTIETEEKNLEAYAIVSAMLPTYFWFQWEKIGELGTKMGLTPHECSLAMKSTLYSSIKLLYENKYTPAELNDLIPVKPIGDCENSIRECYDTKLLGLFEKIMP